MQDMTPDNLRSWITVLLVLWNAGLSVALWLRKPGMDAGAAVDKLRADLHNRHDALVARVALQETDIAGVKVHMQHMPSDDELATLRGSVMELSARTQGLVEAMNGVRATTQRIEAYLLNNSGKP